MKGIATPGICRKTKQDQFVLIQEEVGVHVGISPTLRDTARHAAHVLYQQYAAWLAVDRWRDWGDYKRNHFTIAVGGGNTLKSNYKAWLDEYLTEIDWVDHIRFFLLEESTGEPGWESAESSLVANFIVPLAQKQIKVRGLGKMVKQLKLTDDADEDAIIDALISRMVNGINLAAARRALDDGKSRRALQLARKECKRYELDIQHKVGTTMELHCIVSGIGKDGTIGAFAPYTPELAIREPGAAVLRQSSGALRVALNRGVLTNASYVSLIVSGSLKLKALGRFEMEDTADFEQTVMESPLRLLRENYEIAEKVYIFADEQALHFDETVFEYSENGQLIQNKAETREGEEDGIHIFLVHGLMALFGFINLLIRLPSAWTVSAPHRGREAKHLPLNGIFPYYARALRKAMLKNWRRGRPVPVAGHSIAGAILDHLLLSVLDDCDADIPPYEKLSRENKEFITALRTSGVIYLAAWAPTDIVYRMKNIKNLVAHRIRGAELNSVNTEQTYRENDQGKLELLDPKALEEGVPNHGGYIDMKLTRPLLKGINQGLRGLLSNRRVQQRMLNTPNKPYVMRLVGLRLLKRVSLYGFIREHYAGEHDPLEYQRRHLRAMDILLEYDIPLLNIIHRDDSLVSAQRHWEEHQYLLKRRLTKEGVEREEELVIPARFVPIERASEELPLDFSNPHVLVMSTSPDGSSMSRQITSAMTHFVNENVARAVKAKAVKPLPSVTRWQRKQTTTKGAC